MCSEENEIAIVANLVKAGLGEYGVLDEVDQSLIVLPDGGL